MVSERIDGQMRYLNTIVFVGLCILMVGCSGVEGEKNYEEKEVETPISMNLLERELTVRVFDLPGRGDGFSVADGRVLSAAQDGLASLVRVYSADLYGADAHTVTIPVSGDRVQVTGPRLGAAGELWLLVQMFYDAQDESSLQQSQRDVVLFRLDPFGNVLEEVQMSEVPTYIVDMEADSAGNIYLTGVQDGIPVAWVYASDARKLSEFEILDGDDALVRVGDTVYLGGWSQAVRTVDAVQVETRLYTHGRTWSGLDGRVHFFDDQALYSQAPGTEAAQREFLWSAVDVPRVSVQGLLALGDGVFVLALPNSQMAVLAPVEGEVQAPSERRELVLGTVSPGADLEVAVASFNRAQAEVRIVIDDYSRYSTEDDWTAGLLRLQTDVLAGAGPDILDMSGLPLETFVAQGVLTDIEPLLEAGPGRHALVPEVLRAIEQDGALYMMPQMFYVTTLAGGSLHRGLQGVGVDEFLDYAEALPAGVSPLEPAMTGAGFVQLIAMHHWAELVAADFQTDWFLRLLDYAGTLGEGTEFLPDDAAQLPAFLQVAGFEVRQLYEALFDELILLGMPGVETGSAFGLGRTFAIPSGSVDPAAAFSFVRQMMEQQINWGFPVLQAGLDAMIAEALAASETETWGIGGMVIDVGPITMADVEFVMELIANTATIAWQDGVTWAQVEETLF